jgi:TonB family protein
VTPNIDAAAEATMFDHQLEATPDSFDREAVRALKPVSGLDTESMPYMGISTALHAAFLLVAMMVPATAANLELDDHAADDRFVQILQKPDKHEATASFAMAESTSGGGGGEAQANEETMPEATEGAGSATEIEEPPDAPETEADPVRDQEIAQNAGLAGVFGENTTNMWSNDANSIGAGAMAALNNVEGDGAIGNSEFNGLGIRGTGRGDGDGDNIIGGVEPNTGSGCCGPGGDGPGGPPGPNFDEKEEVEREIDVTTDGAVVCGQGQEGRCPLDKEMIRRVVRQHRREIAYCYETSLQSNRHLEGSVTVNFSIAASGQVIAATVEKSSLNSARVESCMTGKIRHWNFPPHGMALAKVRYPFRFTPRVR